MLKNFGFKFLENMYESTLEKRNEDFIQKFKTPITAWKIFLITILDKYVNGYYEEELNNKWLLPRYFLS